MWARRLPKGTPVFVPDNGAGNLRERRVALVGRRKLHELEQLAKSLVVIKIRPRRIDLWQSRPAIAPLDGLAQLPRRPAPDCRMSEFQNIRCRAVVGLRPKVRLGYLTPPVALNLLMPLYRFRKSVPEVLRATLPVIAVLSIGVLLITYVPWLTTLLPKLVE